MEDDLVFRRPYLDDALLANLYLVPLSIQLLLRHPRLNSHPLVPYLGYALLPVTLYLSYLPYLSQRWKPLEAAITLNVAQSTFVVYSIIRSLEFAFCKEPYHRVKLDDHARSARKELAEESDGALAMLGWVIEGATSVRGIGWSWGPPIDRFPPPHRGLASFLRCLFISNLLYTLSVAFLALSRHPDPFSPTSHLGSLAFSRLGIPSFPGSDTVSDLALTLLFGIGLVASLELDFSLVTLITFLIQTPLSHLLPSLVPRFDWRRWPPFFDSPHLATSMAELWSNRWHAMFRRIFEVGAYRPGSYLARRAGFSRKVQRGVGVTFAFLLSGLMHEFVVTGLTSPPQPSTFPSTLIYFLSQPLAILLLDPLVSALSLPPFLNRLYVWTLTLLVARPFRVAYLSHNLDGLVPSPEVWTWQRWLIPGANLLPKGLLVVAPSSSHRD